MGQLRFIQEQCSPLPRAPWYFPAFKKLLLISLNVFTASMYRAVQRDIREKQKQGKQECEPEQRPRVACNPTRAYHLLLFLVCECHIACWRAPSGRTAIPAKHQYHALRLESSRCISKNQPSKTNHSPNRVLFQVPRARVRVWTTSTLQKREFDFDWG